MSLWGILQSSSLRGRFGCGQCGFVQGGVEHSVKAVFDTQTVVDALPIGMDSGSDVLANLSLTDAHRPFSGSPVPSVADLPNYWTGRVGRHSPGLVPRWRLAWEGPFLAERSSSLLRCFGAGCAFRNMTYHPSDYAPSLAFPCTIPDS